VNVLVEGSSVAAEEGNRDSLFASAVSAARSQRLENRSNAAATTFALGIRRPGSRATIARNSRSSFLGTSGRKPRRSNAPRRPGLVAVAEQDIDDLDLAGEGHHEIGGLDIAVDDPRRVDVVEPQGSLANEPASVGHAERPEAVGQVVSVAGEREDLVPLLEQLVGAIARASTRGGFLA